MLIVKRKGSNKRKRRKYEAIEFYYYTQSEPVLDFLGNLGELELCSGSIESGARIKLWDGRIITPNQILLKDGSGKILTFDPTIFYAWFDVWSRVVYF